MPEQQLQNKTQPKQEQKSNTISIKKILKLVFLGNGKYWPTTVFLWVWILYFILIQPLELDSYSVVNVIYGSLYIILVITSIPLSLIPAIEKFTSRSEFIIQDNCGPAPICFDSVRPEILLPLSIIFILIVNIIIIKTLEKLNIIKNPAK